jgi:hypothetical protein
MIMFDIIIASAWILCVLIFFYQHRSVGRMTTLIWVFIGATSICWMEPIWDWLLYLRINPEAQILLPSNIPLLGMADGLPWIVPLVYPLWFSIPTYLMAKVFVRRGWGFGGIFVVSLIFGVIIPAVLEYFIFIKYDIYAYTHVLPHFAYASGSYHQYPLDVSIWMSPVMGAYTVIIARSLIQSSRSETAKGMDVKQEAGKKYFLDRIMKLRAFGGSEDNLALNLFGIVAFSNVLYALMMIPSVIIRFEKWRNIVGNPTPFGHPPWPL